MFKHDGYDFVEPYTNTNTLLIVLHNMRRTQLFLIFQRFKNCTGNGIFGKFRMNLIILFEFRDKRGRPFVLLS